jgi:hypothetical protein
MNDVEGIRMDLFVRGSFRQFGDGRKNEKTYSHLLQGWLPATPGLLNEIKSKIRAAAYSGSEHDIISDIDGDMSLLGRALANVANVYGGSMWRKDPMAVIRSLDDEQLSALFSVSESQLSSSRFDRMNQHQSSLLAHTLRSYSGLEVMREHAEVEGQEFCAAKASSCAVLRLLVPNLVAWNYPQQYTRIVASVRNGHDTFDQAIHRLVGENPNEMAANFASSWGLPAELVQAITFRRKSLSPYLKIDYSDSSSSLALGAICEMAEGIAKLSNPEQFPEAEKQWRSSESDAQRLFGADVTESLLSRVEECTGERLEQYSTALGRSLFAGASKKRTKTSARKRNSYMSSCSDSLQACLEAVYEKLDEAPQAALELVVNSAVSTAGFSCGCIFLSNKNGQQMVPTLLIGEQAQRRYRVSDPYIREVLGQSVFRDVPFSGQGSLADGESMRHVSAAIGGSIEMGVLSLEFAEESLEDPDIDPLKHFKAIRKTLNDCLLELGQRREQRARVS